MILFGDDQPYCLALMLKFQPCWKPRCFGKRRGSAPQKFIHVQASFSISRKNLLFYLPTGTMSKAEADLATLKITVQSTVHLIEQLLAATKLEVNEKSTESAADIPKESTTTSSVNGFDLIHDAASLIRAHTTKLSLLIINEPFTPTAICTILRELASGPLPALATAVELCDAASYTGVVRSEVQWRVDKVYTELSVLIKDIPLDGKTLSKDRKLGTGSTTGKGSLASTGVVWQSCDNLIELKKLGIPGLLVQKAEQYRDTLKDALEELREWGEETSDDEDEVAFESDEDNPAQAAVDDMFGSQKHIPEDDVNKIREKLESSLRRLKLLTLMYQAIVKRRFKTLPSLSHLPLPQKPAARPEDSLRIIQCLDEVMSLLKNIPNIVDELASAFYEIDAADIEKRMDECFSAGSDVVELLVLNWEGQKDEFTVWVSYRHRIDKYMLTVVRPRNFKQR